MTAQRSPFVLEVVGGSRQGMMIPVMAVQFVIGSGLACQLRAPSLDRHHCTVSARDGRFFLTDLNSADGTFLNDRQIVGEVEIIDRDRLRIGKFQFVVHIPACDYLSA
jgi:pSer/pThr/pTyr-binding forkhead associated (FHA) protein